MNNITVNHLKAGAALDKGQIVKLSGVTWVPATANDDAVKGVVTDDCSAGTYAGVVVQGEADVKLGAQLTLFGKVMANASGHAIDHTTTGDEVALGTALEVGDSGAEGYARIMVDQFKQIGAGALETRAKLAITVNAEVGDAVTIDIQAQDQYGNSLAEVVEVIVEAYELTMIEAVAAEFTLAETGAGTIISTTANARIHLQTSAAGAAQVTIADVGTDRNQNVPINAFITNYDGPTNGVQTVFATFAT